MAEKDSGGFDIGPMFSFFWSGISGTWKFLWKNRRVPSDKLHKFGIHPWLVVLWFFVALAGAILFALPGTRESGHAVLIDALWLIPPIILWSVLWDKWIHYANANFIFNQKNTLLEIRLPKRVSKSPKAMELFFAAMHNGSEGDFVKKLWKGKVRDWWSYEMVSIGGILHFYVWTPKMNQPYLEAQLYAQFPDVEISETEDYTNGVFYRPGETGVWGCEHKLAKDDAFPIKTYTDYELDRDPKTEFKVDPLSGVFETLSMIGPNEQMWVQIVVRKDASSRKKKDTWAKSEGRWQEEVKEKIDKIWEDAQLDFTDSSGEEKKGAPMLKPAQRQQLDALTRSLDKPGYEVGIRTLYLFKEGSFHLSRIVPGLLSLYKNFGSEHLNGFKPTGWLLGFDFAWQDFKDKKKDARRRGVLEAYKRRAFFHYPFKRSEGPFFKNKKIRKIIEFFHPNNNPESVFVLTTEELATIYHFPSEETKAPGLERVESTRGEPPANLPV